MLVAPKVVSACQPDDLPAGAEIFSPSTSGLHRPGHRPTTVESSIENHPNGRGADRQAGEARFPRTARLLKPSDFKRVFKNSTTSADRYLKVLACVNECGCSRLGMAVSRQVDKHAVGRNRIKRVIREYFRHQFPVGAERPAGSIPVGIDLVVLPRRECATISNHQLTVSLASHCRRIMRVLERKRSGAVEHTLRPGTRRVNEEAGTI